MENELVLAPGKNVSPPVAAEVLFLFPQQQQPPEHLSGTQQAAAAEGLSEQPSGPCYHTDVLRDEGKEG